MQILPADRDAMTYKIAGMYQDSSLRSDDRWVREGIP